MAAMTAAEISYTTTDRFITAPGRIRRKVTVSFPTGANAATNNQYVTGGIALDKSALGCPRTVQRIDILGGAPVAGNQNARWFWNGDTTNPKLAGYANASAGAPDAELANTTAFTAAQTLVCEIEGW